MKNKITVPALRACKNKANARISAYTAYDFAVAQLVDQAGADLILVGDSLGCVVQGQQHTLGVTLADIIYHTKCVTSADTRALCVADMPFFTAEISDEKALINASRLISEGGAAAVKIEGGSKIAPRIKTLTEYNLPVVGHLGLTPQSFHHVGGHKKQGGEKSVFGAEKIYDDALAIAESGAFALVLECIPTELAERITKAIAIPTIGIGIDDLRVCDGQIAVSYDLLGLSKAPGFIAGETATQLRQAMIKALTDYNP